MSNGIYLKCDKCGATLGGEQVTPKSEPTLNQWQGGLLREIAYKRGWHHEAPDFDLCGECESERIRNDPDLTLSGCAINTVKPDESLEAYIERTYLDEMAKKIAGDLEFPVFDSFITGTGVEPKPDVIQVVESTERGKE